MKSWILPVICGLLAALIGTAPSAQAATGAPITVSTTFAFKPAATNAAHPMATIVITCVSQVDNVHWSSGTGLPNVHARITCDHPTYSLTTQVAIYRESTQVGTNGNGATVYGKTSIEVTANASQRICGYNYHGEMGFYIVAPPGYSPHSAEGWHGGASSFLACGSCGGAHINHVTNSPDLAVVESKTAPLVQPRC